MFCVTYLLLFGGGIIVEVVDNLSHVTCVQAAVLQRAHPGKLLKYPINNQQIITDHANTFTFCPAVGIDLLRRTVAQRRHQIELYKA